MAARARLATALATLVLTLHAGAAAATDVYKWKDARGVTHYGDAPPPGQALEPRKSAAPRPARAVAAVSADCTNARGNLRVLQAAEPVGLDFDRDGRVDRPMTDAERTERLAKAKKDIEAHCEVALDRR